MPYFIDFGCVGDSLFIDGVKIGFLSKILRYVYLLKSENVGVSTLDKLEADLLVSA